MSVVINMIIGGVIGYISHKTEGPIERAFETESGGIAHVAKYGVGFVITFLMFIILDLQRKYPGLSKDQIKEVRRGNFNNYVMAWFGTGAGVLLGHMVDVWVDDGRLSGEDW